MNLRPCPFCGGEDIANRKPDHPVTCMGCGASAISAMDWNTRAAPTMKAWEWCEGDGANEVWACLDFEAYVYRDGNMWHSYVDKRCVGHWETPEAGKNACVAYVEGKLKEWLV